MNIIKQLTMNMAAKVQYTIPERGTFLAIWEFNGEPYSATYKYQDRGNGEKQLQVFVDGYGYCDAGCGMADDYYALGDLHKMASGELLSKLIAILVIEVS